MIRMMSVAGDVVVVFFCIGFHGAFGLLCVLFCVFARLDLRFLEHRRSWIFAGCFVDLFLYRNYAFLALLQLEDNA